MMDERGRVEKQASPPDSQYWLAQNDIARVFDELIANIDRNQGNMLIDKQWKVWLIDHSRAFRTTETLRNPQSVRRCEQSLLAEDEDVERRDAQGAARRLPDAVRDSRPS